MVTWASSWPAAVPGCLLTCFALTGKAQKEANVTVLPKMDISIEKLSSAAQTGALPPTHCTVLLKVSK